MLALIAAGMLALIAAGTLAFMAARTLALVDDFAYYFDDFLLRIR